MKVDGFKVQINIRHLILNQRQKIQVLGTLALIKRLVFVIYMVMCWIVVTIVEALEVSLESPCKIILL